MNLGATLAVLAVIASYLFDSPGRKSDEPVYTVYTRVPQGGSTGATEENYN